MPYTNKAIRKPRQLGQSIEPILKHLPLGFHASQRIGGFQNIKHNHGGGHRRNFSPEGKTEENLLKGFHHIRAADNACNRKTIPHCFSKARHVRHYVVAFLRATETKVKTRTDFVENQQCTVLMSEFFHL